MMRFYRIRPVPVLLVLGLLAFRGGDDKIGLPAPDFTLTTLDGTPVSLSAYRGKVVLLDFWASWCGPCKEEMPFLVTLHRQYEREGLAVVTINIDDEADNARAFLASLPGRKPPFPVVWDREKTLPARYEITAMPTSVLIDRKGVVRYWHNGFKAAHRDRYRKELNLLLHES